jgi:serine/threonine protein kinase
MSEPFATRRFALLAPLGEGGMGAVYEASDRATGEIIALKTLHELDAAALYRFKQEFRSIADVAHPNIVKLGELFEEDGQWFFTMERVHGAPFLEYVTRDANEIARASREDERDVATPTPTSPTSGSGPLDVDTSSGDTIDPETTLGARPRRVQRASRHTEPRGREHSAFDERKLRDALAQLVLALDHLHRAGIVHRDIKSSNVLVEPSGRVVLLDLGALAAVTVEAHDDDAVVAGTIAYMAPEQARGERAAPAADYYALGVLLYQALTGQKPFGGRASQILRDKQTMRPVEPTDLREGIPPSLSRLAMSLLSTDPALRPGAPEVLEALGTTSRNERASETTFVGREAELSRLTALFEAKRDVTARVLVAGEPGMGKSTLVRTFLEQTVTAHPEALVFRSRCHAQESLPFKAFDGIVDALGRFLGRAGRGSESLIPDDAHLLGSLFPTLRAVPGFDAAPRDARGEVEAEPSAIEQRTRAFEALRALLTALGAHRRVVLCIDDIQWADDASFALLEELLASPAPPVFVIATARADLLARMDSNEAPVAARALDRFERLVIEGLDEDRARALVRSLLGEVRYGAHARAIETALVRAHGHPLFLRELVRQIEHRGTADTSLCLDDALYARVGALEDVARDIVVLVAIAGFRMDRELVSEILGIERKTCAARLRELRREQLVRIASQPEGVSVEAFHDRVRESVQAHLSQDARVVWHGRIADALARRRETLSDPIAYVQHLALATRTEEAAREAFALADLHSRTLAFEQVAALLRLAVRYGDLRGEEAAQCEARIGDAFRAAGRARDAAEAYLRACATHDPSLRRRCRRLAGEHFILSGEIVAGTRQMDLAAKEAGIRRPPRFVMMLAIPLRERRLLARDFARRPTSSTATDADRHRLDVHASIFRSMNLVDPITTAYHIYAHAFEAWSLGESYRAMESIIFVLLTFATMHGTKKASMLASWRRGLAGASEELPSRTRAWLDACNAAIDGILGGSESLVDRLEKVERFYLGETERDPMQLIFVRSARLEALRTSGRIAALVAYDDSLLREARRRNDRLLEAFAVKSGSIAWLARDDAEGGRLALDKPLWSIENAGFQIHHLYELRARLELALYEDDRTDLWRRFRRRFLEARLSMMSLLAVFRLEMGFAEARARLADANAPRSRRAVAKKVRAIARSMADHGNPEHRVKVALVEASAAELEGDMEAAVARLDEAIAQATETRQRLEVAAAQMKRAALTL